MNSAVLILFFTIDWTYLLLHLRKLDSRPYPQWKNQDKSYIVTEQNDAVSSVQGTNGYMSTLQATL